MLKTLLPQGEMDQIQNRLFTTEANAIRATTTPTIAQAQGFAK